MDYKEFGGKLFGISKLALRLECNLFLSDFGKNILSCFAARFNADFLLAKYLKLTVQNLTKLNYWEDGSIFKNIVKILYH